VENIAIQSRLLVATDKRRPLETGRQTKEQSISVSLQHPSIWRLSPTATFASFIQQGVELIPPAAIFTARPNRSKYLICT